ncbi:MAG: ABC transporter permease [Chloroflexi bacterium]|nr:ABC transporter permease [Chloroflexota bacterium]
MKKLILIGLKDLKLTFRDTSALLMMLLAPFLLTLGMGFVTGAFSGSDASGVSSIPVILVNQDGGQLGNALVDLFNSAGLQELVDASEMDEVDTARLAVDDDTAAAVIVIPPGFTDSIIPTGGQSAANPVQIQIYSNPTRPTSVGVIKTILEQFINQVEIARIGGEVAVTQLLANGFIDVQDAAIVGQQVGETLGETDNSSISLKGVTNSGGEVNFNALAYMAPGMALMFLMYTASYGGKALLTERNQGTLPRLLVSPTSTVQVLGGKVFGTFLTGAAQVLILIISTALLFNLQWGDSLGVLVLVLAAVFAAVGWGMLITAVAKTPGQVQWVGMTVMLTFGLLGGSFFSVESMPGWFRTIGKITPNAWGIDGFATLAQGGRLADISASVLGLLVMGAVLFAISVWLFKRNNIAQQ